MVNLIGFHGPNPFSIIFWQVDGKDQSKTVCYSQSEEEQAVARLHTPGDFYSAYDKAIIFRSDETVLISEKVYSRGA